MKIRVLAVHAVLVDNKASRERLALRLYILETFHLFQLGASM